MDTVFLPELVIDANSAEDGIKTLFKSVKPEWSQEQIIIKKMSGGYSCITSCVHLEGNPDDAYTVRVRNLSAKVDTSNIANPEFEVKVVQELAKIGLFPTVHAVFENGFCYAYIKGKPIINFSEKIGIEPGSEEKVKKAMIQKLAEINSIILKSEDYSKTNFFTNVEKMLENYPTENSDLIDKAIVSKELYELLHYSKEFDLKIVLCHGDPHPGNVVWNREDDKITFVDWEISHIGYQAYDVAYSIRMLHFEDIISVSDLPPSSNHKVLSNETRKEITKWYFEKWSELNSLEFDEDSFREFLRQVIFFELVWCISFVIMFGVVFNANKSHFKELPSSPEQIMRNVYDYYCSVKEQRLQDLNLKMKK